MNSRDDKSGIVLQCDHSGEIVKVIRDDLGITAVSLSAPTLFDVVDPPSRVKVREFLQAVIEGRAAFGWEVNIRWNGNLESLLLIGGLTDIGVVICGSLSSSGLHKLFDEMMKLQNEQINALRTTLKDDQLEAAKAREREQEMLESFTRLNNELVNTQRELARRNAELADANVLLESLATTDGLTGLKNHRVFQDALEREHDRARRYEAPLSLVMLDVDQFKQFNDQFGHPAGDQVLKQVAHVLTSESRSDALVARYGGEEFAVILPNCGVDDALGVAQRIRRAIEAGPWDLRPITASLGTATLTPSTPNRAALIAEADAAMYRAKVGGRNQVCSGSDTLESMQSLAL